MGQRENNLLLARPGEESLECGLELVGLVNPESPDMCSVSCPLETANGSTHSTTHRNCTLNLHAGADKAAGAGAEAGASPLEAIFPLFVFALSQQECVHLL